MINVPALLALLICVLLFDGAYAGTSLMGVGGGGGGMPKGISFNIDTNDKRTTRIHGNAIKVDLDMLEIMTNGGKLKYSPTHMEFETGTTRWMTTMTPIKIAFYQNDKAIIQLFLPEDDSPYYYMTMGAINVAVHDLIIDKTLTGQVLLNLCVAEKASFYSQLNLNRQRPSEAASEEGEEGGAAETAEPKLEVDIAVLRSQCEQELQGIVPTDAAAADAPKLPRHVTSVAQLLEYSSRVTVQQGRVLEAVAAAADVSGHLKVLETQLEAHSSRTAGSLSALEADMEEVVSTRLVEANETTTAALAALNRSLEELEEALAEELKALGNSTEQQIYASGNATAQEIFDYIYYNVSAPIRDQINATVTLAQEEAAALLEVLLEGLYLNITEGALLNATATLEGLLAEELQLVLAAQSEQLAAERATAETRFLALDGYIAGNASESDAGLEELHAMMVGLRNSTGERLLVLSAGLELAQAALRNESSTQAESLVEAIAAAAAAAASQLADLAATTYANATQLEAELTEDFQLYVNNTVRQSAESLAKQLTAVNSSLARDLAAQGTELNLRLTGLNASTSSALAALNASLVSLTVDRVETLRRNLTADVARNVYEPLKANVDEVSAQTNTSISALDAAVGVRLVELNTSLGGRLELVRKKADAGLLELEELQRGRTDALQQQLAESTAALVATNMSLREELGVLNGSMATSLTKLQSQLQSDISSVHLIATMVNYTIVDGLLVDMRTEAQANHSELVRQLGDSAVRADAERNRSLTDHAFLVTLAREINATLTDAVMAIDQKHALGHTEVDARVADVNSTLRTAILSLNQTWHQASAAAVGQLADSLQQHVAASDARTSGLNLSLSQHLEVYEEEMVRLRDWREASVEPQLKTAAAALVAQQAAVDANFTTAYVFMASNITTPLVARANSLQEQLFAVNARLDLDLQRNLSALNASASAAVDALGEHVDEELTQLEAALYSIRDTDVPRLNAHVERLLNFSVSSALLTEGNVKQVEALGATLTGVIQPQLLAMQGNVTALLVGAEVARERLDGTIVSSVAPLGLSVAEAARRLDLHDTAIALLQQENATVQRLTGLFTEVTTALTATHGSQIAALQEDLRLTERSLTNVTLYVDRLVTKMEYVVSTNLVTQEAANSRMEEAIRTAAGKVVALEGNVTMVELNIKQLQGQNKAKDEVLGTVQLQLKGQEHDLAALKADNAKLEQAAEQDRKLHQSQAIAVQLLESKVAQLERRNAELESDLKVVKATMASQDSVDQLRKLLFDMQSSVITHSNKVLDVIISSNSGDSKK